MALRRAALMGLVAVLSGGVAQCSPARPILSSHAKDQIVECRSRGGFPRTEIDFAWDPPIETLKECVLPCGQQPTPGAVER